MTRHRIDSVAKLRICKFVSDNSPNTSEVLDFAENLLGRRLSQSTISTILRANNLQIQKEGGRGRRVINFQPLKNGSRDALVPSFERSTHDEEISEVANVPLKNLTMLTVGRSRNRGSRNSMLEVHMLEEIYLTLLNATKIISRSLLLSYVDLICKTRHCIRPTNVPRFLRELCKKYFLAEKVSLFLYSEISYESMLKMLIEVFPSLQFVATPTEAVKHDSIGGIAATDELSTYLDSAMLDKNISVPICTSFDGPTENLTFDSTSTQLDCEPWTTVELTDLALDHGMDFDNSPIYLTSDLMLDTPFLDWDILEETKFVQFSEDVPLFMAT